MQNESTDCTETSLSIYLSLQRNVNAARCWMLSAFLLITSYVSAVLCCMWNELHGMPFVFVRRRWVKSQWKSAWRLFLSLNLRRRDDG